MTEPTSGVVVDVRALQSHEHASRGIGRYTLELIRAVEAGSPGLVRAYVADPAFPMHEQVRELLATGRLIRADDPELTRRPPRVLHVTSPFVEGHGHVELLPRWARGVDTRVVATVYDLIPARFPEIYLRDPDVAAQHEQRLHLLRACDRLLSISSSTTADLTDLVGVPPERIVTIHGAAGAEFVAPESPREQLLTSLGWLLGDTVEDGYVLCPTGIEWRKNLDRLLVAWSTLPPSLRSAHPLVVQCALTAEARAHLEARTVELGISESVVLTGSVDGPTLVALMQAATLVVYPSTYEGLGLPVLEARRAGAAVIAGDNSSLVDLVGDPEASFDATDPDAIAASIHTHLTDHRRRHALAAVEVDDRFTWAAAGAATAAVYRELLDAPTRAPRRAPRRPRLAVASPVPPQLSGPSAYMASLAGPLAQECDLTVLTSIDPADALLPEGVRVEALSTLEQLEALDGPFDQVLYLLGNSTFHADELAMLRRRPGAVLLHDARLTLLYSDLFRDRPELTDGTFGELLHRMYPGRYPAAMGGAQYLPIHEEALFGVLMIAEVARLATRLFVHSSHAADLIELDCGRRPEVAFSIPSPVIPEASPPEGPPLIASFGFPSPAKRTEAAVEAVAQLDDAELVLVGHAGDGYLSYLRDLAAQRGAADRVTVTGATSAEEYAAWVGRTSLALQLRRHSNGESSASVAETLAAGIPTVVSDLGTFSEYPDDVVVKVPADISTTALSEVIAELLDDPARRAELSRSGRSFATANSYPIAASRLVRTLFDDHVEAGAPFGPPIDS
ncbi:MAG: glycosyltransferase [Actinomycetota bacterium]|nr:glycosyltransferase [Actinomycetota bacterium]